MWSLATVECPHTAAFRAGASRLNFRQIRLFKPQEMSNAVRTSAQRIQSIVTLLRCRVIICQHAFSSLTGMGFSNCRICT